MPFSLKSKYSATMLVNSFFVLCFSCLLLNAQQTEFIPKSKKEVEKDIIVNQKERKRIVSSGIITVTQTKYLYKFGKVQTNGITESMTRFNTKGNISRVINYNISDGQVLSSTSYRYDKNENLIEEQFKKDNNIIKTVHRYNARYKKIETVQYKVSGAIDRKISYIYDDTGLLLETVGRLDDGKIYMRDSYIYNSHGNIVEFKNNLRKFTMTFDRNRNMKSISKYQRYFKLYDSVQYNLSERFVFEYDRFDNLIELLSYRPDSSLKTRTQYLLSETGLVLAEKEFGGDGRLAYSRILKYDKNQNLIEETGSDRALKFKNVFKYDAKGNKTDWISYDQINEPVSLIKYTFGKYGTNDQPSSPNFSAQEDTLFADEDDPEASEEFFKLLGSRIIAPDGTYLGMIIADTANPQSILNSWGQYGFMQSATSIFNPSVLYGGEKGIFSPFNAKSPSPPSIFKDGKFFSYLTDNDSFRPRSAPHRLIEFLKNLSRQN